MFMQTLRIASGLPAPFSMSDYEPFRPVGDGTFGLSEIKDVTEKDLSRAAGACRKAFGRGDTVGYCPVETVRAVFFDMDSTVIREESIVCLAEAVGKSDHVREVTERAMRGEIPFKQALVDRVRLLEGVPLTKVMEVAEALTLSEGIEEFCAFCREVGVPTYLISGGFVHLAEVIQRKVGFHGIHANVLGVDSGGLLTGKVEGEIVDGTAKRNFFLRTCRALGIDGREATAVGDGANDIPMMEVAGCAVGFQPKEILRDLIHAQNQVGDHRFLGPLLFGRDLGIVRNRIY